MLRKYRSLTMHRDNGGVDQKRLLRLNSLSFASTSQTLNLFAVLFKVGRRPVDQAGVGKMTAGAIKHSSKLLRKKKKS